MAKAAMVLGGATQCSAKASCITADGLEYVAEYNMDAIPPGSIGRGIARASKQLN